MLMGIELFMATKSLLYTQKVRIELFRSCVDYLSQMGFPGCKEQGNHRNRIKRVYLDFDFIESGLLQKDVEVRRHRGNFSFRWISYYICSRILIHQPILQYVDAANFSVFYVCFPVHLLHIQYINYIVMYFL